MTTTKDYTVYYHEADCCPSVNRNRYDVDLVVPVRNGEPQQAYCQWCNSKQPLPDDFDPTNESIKVGDWENDKATFLYKGRTFTGRPGGHKEWDD